MTIEHALRRAEGIIQRCRRSRTRGLLVAVLLPLCGAGWADPPARAASAVTEEVLFVGHFGEKIAVDPYWDIRAAMHDGMEVVSIHPRYKAGSLERFEPKPSDFKPEGFSHLQLLQLLVIPRSASSFRSLVELESAKTAELRGSGVGFRVVKPPFFGGWSGGWPDGAFEVLVSTPYRLRQLYVETPDVLAILTGGVDDPPSSVLADAYEGVRVDVRNWLVPEGDVRSPAARRLSGSDEEAWIVRTGLTFAALRRPVVWGPWAGISLLGLLLWVLSPRGGRASAWGRQLCLLPNVAALLGAGAGALSWRHPYAGRHFPFVIAVAAAALPVFVEGLSRLTSAFDVWTRRLTAVLSIILAVLLVRVGGGDWGAGWNSSLPVIVAVTMFLFGAAIIATRALFIFYEGRGRQWRAPMLLGVFLCIGRGGSAQAQPVVIEKDTPRPIEGGSYFEALQNLSKRGISSKTFRNQAVQELNRKGRPIYKYQRVEITGIWSRDDTDMSIPGLFDKQMKPSELDKPPKFRRNPLGMFLELIGRDLVSLGEDERGGLSRAAENTVRELLDRNGKPVEVNEIVAHSWGTAIVYDAILSGVIKPPRKLIIAGEPDHDSEKWRSLAKFTGTEVVFYGDSDDPAAGTARGIGKLWESLKEKVGLPPPANPFDAQWEDQCSRRTCNEHGRVPPPPKYDYSFDGITHGRRDYYRAMMYNGDLDNNVDDLEFEQEAAIRGESERFFQSAVDDEVAKIDRQKSAETARLGVDAEFSQRLRGLVVRVCSGDAVTQSEIDDLPPISGPGSVAVLPPAGLSKCASDLYLHMSLQFASRDIPQADMVNSGYKVVIPEGARPAPPPAERPQFLPQWYGQDVNVPELARLACDAPAELTKSRMFDLLPYTVVMPDHVPACRGGGPPLSACARAVLARLCSHGDIHLLREQLLAIGREEQARLAQSPPSTYFAPDEPRGGHSNDAPIGHVCGPPDHPGEPGWCTQ